MDVVREHAPGNVFTFIITNADSNHGALDAPKRNISQLRD